MAKENKSKRKLKTEPRLNIQLSKEQKKVKEDFYQYDVNFVLGDFGSGKTAVCAAIAISSFRKKEFNKIIITRPVVKNSLGFLPGEMTAKMQPWVYPIIHNFNMCQSSNTTEKMLKDGQIEILPIDFAKGVTYVDSVVIIDEFTDMDYTDFRTMLTRLGRGSKVFFCGSEEQIDKSINGRSCIKEVLKLKDSGLVGFNTLKDNHRNPMLTEIINKLEK